MENELFDKFFGPPMNMTIPILVPKNDEVNFIYLGGGLLILFLWYKLNSQKKEKDKIFL